MTPIDQIKRYASCIYCRDDWVELRALKNGNARKWWYPAHALLTPVAELEALNRDGWNVYVGPNARKNEGLSGDDNVALCRNLFVDFDHVEATDGLSPSEAVLATIEEKGLPIPTLAIFSGHGVHCYWRLRESIPPDQWRAVQERLNAHLGSDPSIKNPERIMRVPGFRNMKGDPVDCFIVHANKDLVYRLADIEGHLPQIPLPPLAPTLPTPCQKLAGYAEQKARAILYAAKWDRCDQGERNASAFRHAAQLLRDFDLQDTDAWEIIGGWNSSNDPPLDEKELRVVFDDARKYAKGGAGSKLIDSLSRRRPAVPDTQDNTDPAAELKALIEAEIAGAVVNVEWPSCPILTDLGQCLTPGTRTLMVGGIGASKSLFLLQAAAGWVERGVKVAVLELERGRDFHLNQVLAQRAGIADITKPQWVRENAERVRGLFAEYRDYLHRVGQIIHTAPRRFTAPQAADWIKARAREGYRIICIDPITSLMRGRDLWRDDEELMDRAEKIARESGASLVFVTHAKKGAGHLPDMDSLAGSAAWARFADAILWLQNHDAKVSTVRLACGADVQMHNRTLHLLKTRSGEGTGLRLAYNFDVTAGLTLKEVGLIVKRRD